MVRRFLFVLGALLLVGIGFGLPAQAAYTPPGGIVIDKPVVNPGETVTVSGQACAPGVNVQITLGGAPIATVTTGADGTFTISFEVPVSTAPGGYTVDATNCTDDVLSTNLTVLGADPVVVEGATLLPQTGTDSTSTLLRVGVVLVACGGLLAFATRRRTAHVDS